MRTITFRWTGFMCSVLPSWSRKYQMIYRLFVLFLWDWMLCSTLLQVAGNEAFQAGRYSEAVEHYTAALSCTVESRPFAAICFCNRAAAYKALGNITDAIADCSLSIALDGNYIKVCVWTDALLFLHMILPRNTYWDRGRGGGGGRCS